MACAFTGWTKAAALALLATCGCSRWPANYPAPRQFNYEAQHWKGDFVDMSEPNAAEYVVSGVIITTEPSLWRWTNGRPELRFILLSSAHRIFVADVGTVDATLSHTGPVTLRFRVNGNQVGEAHYSKAGQYHFEAPVPAEWLKLDDPVSVVIEADPVWVSPADGARLGFLLFQAGFK